MEKQIFIMAHDVARIRAIDAVRKAPEGYIVKIQEPTRTLEQNARLWAMLTDISEQVVWHGNKLSQHEWKDVFTAALRKQTVVPGIDGGFVVCGQRTSKMTKKQMAELQELMAAFGAEQSVVFWEGNLESA